MMRGNNWSLLSEGKVRKVYENMAGTRVILVAGDEISAFDANLGASFKGKGAILTRMSRYWFDETHKLIPNAYEMAKEDSEESSFLREQWVSVDRVMEMVKLKMIPVEAIVRGYITGSAWKAYAAGEREICGVELPEGLVNSGKLPTPIFTPTTKAPKGQHDENISYDQLVEIMEEMEVFEPELAAKIIEESSLLLFDYASKQLAKKGIILADSKFEFGIHPETGKLLLADELFTPDSSRFWSLEDYAPGREQASLDKQIIRDWVKEHPGQKIDKKVLEQTKIQYEKICQMVTGHIVI